MSNRDLKEAIAIIRPKAEAFRNTARYARFGRALETVCAAAERALAAQSSQGVTGIPESVLQDVLKAREDLLSGKDIPVPIESVRADRETAGAAALAAQKEAPDAVWDAAVEACYEIVKNSGYSYGAAIRALKGSRPASQTEEAGK